jgi:hypothetical protein
MDNVPIQEGVPSLMMELLEKGYIDKDKLEKASKENPMTLIDLIDKETELGKYIIANNKLLLDLYNDYIKVIDLHDKLATEYTELFNTYKSMGNILVSSQGELLKQKIIIEHLERMARGW